MAISPDICHTSPNIILNKGKVDKKYDTIICDIKNKHRETGSVWYAYNYFPEIDFFFFIQDYQVEV